MSVQLVEDDISRGMGAGRDFGPRSTVDVEPLLQQVEIRFSVAQDDDLPVEHGTRGHTAQEVELGVTVGDVGPPPVAKAISVSVDKSEGPHAVPFHFEDVLVRVKGLPLLGEHGRDEVGEGFEGRRHNSQHGARRGVNPLHHPDDFFFLVPFRCLALGAIFFLAVADFPGADFS